MSNKYDKNFFALKNNIIYYRKLYGYTQQQVADKLNIDRSTLAKMENGQCRGTVENLMALSDIFAISVGTLLDTEKNKLCLETDKATQEEFIAFCNKAGISAENAIAFYIKQVLHDKRFPYEVSAENN